MSVLSNKYGVPEPTIKKMINDGVISCSWTKYDEVYDLYQKLKKTGVTKYKMYMDISIELNINERTVKDIILKLDKI